MDKLGRYRAIVEQLLADFTAWVNQTPPPDQETICVFDEGRDYYLVLNVTWAQYRCVQSAQVFVRLRNEKIWIEEDWTQDGIATELIKAGVPSEDIVLGFQPEEMRPYTEFAIA
ncbi:MAG: XisI protein [Anaerolineae bacterium]|nr:XisI protein [Anaerolineae bacterium]